MRQLIEYVTKRPYIHYLTGEVKLPDRYYKYMKLIRDGYPPEYIMKKAQFYGFDFYILEGVFVPRDETEVLVEVALKHISDGDSLLDLGSGTGCIGITIAKIKNVRVWLVDVSGKCCKVIKKNIMLHGIKNAVCLKMDAANIRKLNMHFDFLVSNPPYVKDSHIKNKYEPRLAISGGKDGLEKLTLFYEAARPFIKKRIFFEAGYDTIHPFADYLLRKNERVYIHKDYSGIDRIVEVVC